MGKPELPRYKKTGYKSFFITNQDCHIYEEDEGFALKFPYTKYRLYLGTSLPEGYERMKQVNVARYYDTYKISIVYEASEQTASGTGEGIIGIDLGVDNFIAIAGMNESILVNGRVIKSRNQYYNKERARLYSIYDRQNRDTKRRTTRRMERLSKKRNNWMTNYMHHCSRYIVDYCISSQIGTIVIGKNEGWKQNSDMGKKSNQQFISIPHSRLISLLRYKCEEKGIRLIETEESYTSRSSFVSRDEMEEGKASGRRISRGLYENEDGSIVNADINGAANIIRKVYPEIEIPLESLQKVRKVNVAW